MGTLLATIGGIVVISWVVRAVAGTSAKAGQAQAAAQAALVADARIAAWRRIEVALEDLYVAGPRTKEGQRREQ